MNPHSNHHSPGASESSVMAPPCWQGQKVHCPRVWLRSVPGTVHYECLHSPALAAATIHLRTADATPGPARPLCVPPAVRSRVVGDGAVLSAAQALWLVAGAILLAEGLSPGVWDGPAGTVTTGFIPNRWRAQGLGSAGHTDSLPDAVQDNKEPWPFPPGTH